MIRFRDVWAGLSILLTSVPSFAVAQSRSAEDVLSFLVTNQAVPTGDFEKDLEAAQATRETLVRSLLGELETVPLTTPSGGFSYRFDPSLGTVERASQTFGAFFVDRASIAGKGYASVSATFRHAEFTTLEGRDLRAGTFVTNANKFRDEATPFDVDTLTLRIRTNTATFFGSYSVSDRVEVGVAVPIVHISLSGERSNNYRGAATVQARGEAVSVGVADIPVRTKVIISSSESLRTAASVELHLPTGDRNNLRGNGRAAVKSSFLASSGQGPVETHLNAALVAGGLSNEAIVAGAVTASAAGRLTLSAETVVRRIGGAGGIREASEPHPFFGGVDTTRLLPARTGTTSVAIAAGLRWNIASTWLVNSYVLFPASGGGLRARLMPAFTVDYSFVP